MNLGTARESVRFYVNEPVAAHFSDARLNALIVDANYELAALAMTKCQDTFVRVVRVNVPAGSQKLSNLNTVNDIDTTTPVGRWATILGVVLLADGAVASDPSDYLDIPLEPVHYITNLWKPIEQQARYAYKFLRRDMWLWPIPKQDLQLRIVIVPIVATPVVDADLLLSIDNVAVELPEWAELVPMLAALKAKAGVPDELAALSALYKLKLQTFTDSMGLTQQRQQPSRVGR